MTGFTFTEGHSKLKTTCSCYFFTPARKYNHGKRTKRITPNGRWTGLYRSHKKKIEFKEKNGNLRGTMKPLSFCLKIDEKREEDTLWLMDEYRLDEWDAFSLCKVYRKVDLAIETLHDTSSSSSDDDIATGLLMIPQALA